MTEHKNLAAALSAFQADLTAVKKGETADTGTYTYRYADLADVAREVYPLLGEHGLAFLCRADYVEDRFVLIGELLHVSGESKTAVFPLPFHDRITPQQIGSAITYGRRYHLGCLTGVVTEEDDDGKAASEVPPAPKKQQQRRSRNIPDIREPLFHDIKTAREAKGWSVEDVQADFALTHDGKKLMDASAKELATYLGTLQAEDDDGAS